MQCQAQDRYISDYLKIKQVYLRQYISIDFIVKKSFLISRPIGPIGTLPDWINVCHYRMLALEV